MTELKCAKGQYRHGLPVAYHTGIAFNAAMRMGISFNSDLLYPLKGTDAFIGLQYPDAGVSIAFNQQNENRKVIAWSTAEASNVYATMGFDPSRFRYFLRGGQVIEFGSIDSDQWTRTSSLTFVKGISATDKPVNNIGEFNVPVRVPTGHVAGEPITVQVDFARSHHRHDRNKAEQDKEYGIQITPSWLTMFAVTEKNENGFNVMFQPPPADGKQTFDWFLVRSKKVPSSA